MAEKVAGMTITKQQSISFDSQSRFKKTIEVL